MDNIQSIYQEKNFKEIEQKYKIKFEDKKLLVQAFSHGSFNVQDLGNYQRLEFLGDAVLQMVVSDYLYRLYPKESEGDMSKKRGALVSEFSLAYVLREEGLDKYILFGRSLKKVEVKNTNSYISDVYEAFIAALYLDKGYKMAEDFIRMTLLERQDQILEKDDLKDYKTILQERLQVNGNIEIKYTTELHDGVFVSKVFLEGNEIGNGSGKTKKQAEQRSAKEALSMMVE